MGVPILVYFTYLHTDRHFYEYTCMYGQSHRQIQKIMLFHLLSKHTGLPETWTEQMASSCSSCPADRDWSCYRNRHKHHHFFQKLILDILSSSRLSNPQVFSVAVTWMFESWWFMALLQLLVLKSLFLLTSYFNLQFTTVHICSSRAVNVFVWKIIRKRIYRILRL